ncbi:MAG: fused MFS/spermidine synthase [Planctomycetota bacterium]|jgi:spermidine synthase
MSVETNNIEKPVKVISRRASINWIMLIYFASGTCSLIDEVVWVRLLKLTLGNTVYASSIVVSIFMGGLALGALIMARFADRIRKRLRMYALLEMLVTISALSLPFALRLADHIYIWFYQAYAPSNSQLLGVQVIISACILLVPSMLMGSTLPLLGRYVTSLEKETGHLVGRLYALNTFGAATGCFLAGFVFIRAFGVMGTLYAAAVLNLIVALGGYILYRFSPVSSQDFESEEIKKQPISPVEKVGMRYYLLVLAFFMSGLISIGYELLWMRSIVHFLGGATYVFSAVLTIYLLGNVIGAGIGSRLAVRLKRPVVGFSITLSLLGLCGVAYLPLLIFWSVKVLPYANSLFETVHKSYGISAFILGPLVQSMFLFLVPTIIMGIGFPIALQGWANQLHKVGRSTGLAYGANTIGAVAGGLLTGFIMIPKIGVQLTIILLGLAGLWVAGILYFEFTPKNKIFSRSSLLGLATVTMILAFILPVGMFNTIVEINKIDPKAEGRDFRLLAVKEGVTTTVSVDRDLDDGALYLYSAGQALAGDGAPTRFDQKILGHYGIMLRKDAASILSVGFGSGETTACFARHNIDRIDCVEIAPEVVDISLKYFTHINLGQRVHDEVNMIFMDAKNYIHLTDNTYDVIMNDSIHPRLFAENASLYAREYYESAMKRLNKNGLFLSWIPTYDMPVSVVDSITGTMLDVFPHVSIWFLNNYNLSCVWLVGTKEPQRYSPKYMEKLLSNEEVRQSLEEMHIYDSIDLLSCYIGDEEDLRKVVGDYHINSDYNPFIEFTVDGPSSERMMFEKYVLNLRTDTIYDFIDWEGFSDDDKKQWIDEYKKHYMAFTELLYSYDAPTLSEKLSYCMVSLKILPDDPALLDARQMVEILLFSRGMEMIGSRRINESLELAASIIKIHPTSSIPWMLRSIIMLEQGQIKNALVAAEKAVRFEPKNPDAHFNKAVILNNMGQFEQAAAEYKKVFDLSTKSYKYSSFHLIRILEHLMASYMNAGQNDKALKTAEQALQIAVSSGQMDLIEHTQNQLEILKNRR